MTYATVAIAYREERLIGPHLKHIPDWVDEKYVLISTKPWFGEDKGPDNTANNAHSSHDRKVVVLQNHWPNEETQRNHAQALNDDKDWLIILDPDEFLDDHNWAKLKDTLETTTADALIVKKQRVFWKDKEVYPCDDYQQLIAVRPHVRFVDKRVVSTSYEVAPVELLHFSWARTDEEVWDKISHYAHANDFDIKKWYKEVWKANKTENLHPTSPETLKGLIPAVLPLEIQRLNLWPKP